MRKEIETTFIEDIVEFDCQACRDGLDLGFDFTMAFQPIIDAKSHTVWGHEALVRGVTNVVELAPSELVV